MIKTAKDFIIREINNVIEKVDGIRIRYEQRNNNHIVEVIPVELFDNELLFIDEEIRIEYEFEKLYPQENIVFVSENSLTKIKNPEYIVESYDNEVPLMEFEFIGNTNDYILPNYSYALAA